MPMFEYNDTLTLMAAMERFKPAASFMLDTFFPNTPPAYTTSKIGVETRKGHRRLAPFVTREGRGVNIGRESSQMRFYEPAMMGPRRVINPDDINSRAFGEGVYSTTTPAQRAAALQARDLRDLQDTIMNRKNKMAADLMTTGKYSISGYADDGVTPLNETIDFGLENIITPAVTWDNPAAKIIDDLQAASELIQENAGAVPTVAICGKNIMRYLRDNTQLQKLLDIRNYNIGSFAPRITAPQAMFICSIPSLSLELYSYAETYADDMDTFTDAAGVTHAKIKPFLDEDTVIIGVQGRGKQLHGAITLVNESGSFETYAANYVPYYNASKESNTLSLTVYSRCVLVPEYVDDWAVIKAKG